MWISIPEYSTPNKSLAQISQSPMETQTVCTKVAREYQENKGLGKNLQGCTLSLEPLIKQGRPGRGNELSSDYGKKYSMSAL